MVRIENPILWIKSKQAISDNPVLWLSPIRHYTKFKKTVSGLSNEELVKERSRYGHNTRNDLVITGLAVAAEVGGAAMLASHVDSGVILVSVGPAAAAACLVGITRGIIRDGEKGFLQEEIERRQGATGKIVFSAPEKA